MTKHLLNAGYELILHDINREAVAEIVAAGAKEANALTVINLAHLRRPERISKKRFN
ncbi:hypothetical protein [Mesonia mobilis]|uniref:hypothetical protein n=1 Tax=Mesonia mobilis TaxID=369791 RepID=UPI0034E8E922